MSNKVTFIDKKAQQLVDILNSGKKRDGTVKPFILLTAATILCLIGATIPHIATYKLLGQSSLFCLVMLVITVIINRKNLPLKQLKHSAAIIGITMILTGCSGLFVPEFTETTPILEYLHEADREYKTGHAEGIAFFGFGLDNATVEQAMDNGNITKTYAIQIDRSFGWIAVARVKVYGE